MSCPERAYGTLSTSPSSLSRTCPYSESPYLDKYEKAEKSINSYSQELRAKLFKYHSSDSVPHFKPLSQDVKRWKLGVTSLEGGKKLRTLLANSRLHPNEAVIEFVGKYQMSNGFVPTSKKTGPGNTNANHQSITPEPFAFFHQVQKNGMCISMDLRKYGNEARFVRRSCKSNAEIRHVVGKGTLHVYIVTTKTVELDEEIVISHEFQLITRSPNNDYVVASTSLPCACVDVTTCTARIAEISGVPPMVSFDGALLKKNDIMSGANYSTPVSEYIPKERKKRVSSRRTSSVDKDSLDSSLVGASTNELSALEVAHVPKATTENSVHRKDSADVPTSGKERTTRARSAANAAPAEEASPAPVSRRPRAESTSGRQRNKSGGGESRGSNPTDSNLTGQSSQIDSHPAEVSKPMSREERKLQSLLKLIERMECNQKKKESRQTQKKDKGKKADDDQDDDHHSDDASIPTPTHTVKFAPSSIKRKGRKRGRSGSNASKASLKPLPISQRNSGSGRDVQSTSTESDMNSADEGKHEKSPLTDNTSSNFRLPKTKKAMMSEWYNTNSPTSSPSGEPVFPQQYMRKASGTATTAGPSPNTPAPQLSTTTPTFNVKPTQGVVNPNMANASGKKKFSCQANCLETRPRDIFGPNSRPNSPLPTDCLAPLKKRRLARASMSTEVSNTPPSTPNKADEPVSEHERDQENETEVSAVQEDSEHDVVKSMSVSEVSSAEEEDMEEPALVEIPPPAESSNKEEEEGQEKFQQPREIEARRVAPVEPSVLTKPIISTPRRSRWDQESKEVVYSPCTSPVKGKTLLDYDYARDRNLCMRLNFNNDGESHIPRRRSIDKTLEPPTPIVPTRLDSNEILKPAPGLVSPSIPADPSMVSPSESPKDASKSKEEWSMSFQQVVPESTPTKRKLSILEYRQRQGQKEGRQADGDLSNSTNCNSNSKSSVISDFGSDSNKDLNNSTAEEPSDTSAVLSWSPTPTLAERQREELGKRLTSLGIAPLRIDNDNSSHTSLEDKHPPIPTSLSISASVLEKSVDKPKPNDAPNKFRRTGSLHPPHPMGIGYPKRSFPTPGALKQSGMPPLPPSKPGRSPSPVSVNNSSLLGKSSTSAGIPPMSYSSKPVSSSPLGGGFHHYGNSQNSSRGISLPSPGSLQSNEGSPSESRMIGGVDFNKKIPPPPPPPKTPKS